MAKQPKEVRPSKEASLKEMKKQAAALRKARANGQSDLGLIAEAIMNPKNRRRM